MTPISSREIACVSMPISRWRSTFRARAASAPGGTSWRNPIGSNPQSPPTMFLKSRKTLRLSNASRDSASLV